LAAETPRDHGGGIDAAIAAYGGTRADWLDLSTGINPVPYPLGEIAPGDWTALPDRAAMDRLIAAARRFWRVPDGAEVIAAPGASALIARMPDLFPGLDAYIHTPTYNEHAAAFAARGALADGPDAPLHVIVHPNNPDGRLWPMGAGGAKATVIDESFCDICPSDSQIARAAEPGTIVLKSFGKFWGLAGLRLGFAIAHPSMVAANPRRPALADLIGPWPVPGPALRIGARALEDDPWAEATRARLTDDAARLDALMTRAGAQVAGGTPLFRLYEIEDAARWQSRLARAHILTRAFPYNPRWLRLGLPGPGDWPRVEAALAG